MDSGVEVTVKSCAAEQAGQLLTDKSSKRSRIPLIPVPLPAADWDRVGIYSIGPMKDQQVSDMA